MSATTPIGFGRIWLAWVLAACVLCMPVVARAAPASSGKLDAAREQAANAREELDELAAELEERSEEYVAAKEELARTRKLARVAADELDEAEADVERAQAQLGARAGSIYRNGRVDLISVMVGVSGFQDFVTRLELLRRVGEADASLVATVKDARSRADRARRSVLNRRAEAEVLLHRAQEKRREVSEALSRQKTYLSEIDGSLERLIAQERARQERIAAKRAAARAAEKARAEAAEVARAAQQAAGDPGADTGKQGSGAGAPSGAHAGVVAVARGFVGVTPYSWGGVTPRGFDCSGLTMYCYRQVGVGIPRTSRQQYNSGTRIPADRTDLLAPGDLVFFGRDGDAGRIHHVGIYSGGGNYIHAPQAGERVSESSLFGRIATRGDYVGAVRP